MSNDILGTGRVGADIEIALDALQGDVDAVSEITAQFRSVTVLSNGKLHFTDDVSIPMVVSVRAADDDNPAGWNLTIAGSKSAGLDQGLYGIDAKIVASDAIEITRTTALVDITQAALS